MWASRMRNYPYPFNHALPTLSIVHLISDDPHQIDKCSSILVAKVFIPAFDQVIVKAVHFDHLILLLHLELSRDLIGMTPTM